MRVVMPILEYRPILGGAQRQIEALAPLLAERGIEVHVVTRSVPGEPARERLGGAEVHRLPAPGPKAMASIVWTALVLQRLHTLRPNVIHAFSLFSPATIAVLARSLFGTAVAVKILRGGRGGDVQRLGRKVFSSLRQRAMRKAVGRFVSISDEIDGELAGMGIRSECRVRIPNGVDVTRFRPLCDDQKLDVRTALGLEGGPIVVHCGRWVPEKRVNSLFEIWPQFRARYPDARLLLLGAGPDEAKLRATAPDGVEFIGAVDDVAPYLQVASAFVLPSSAEGLSNALLEAMSAGLPVVATRVGGAPDVIDDHVNGRLVGVDDSAALCEALTQVCQPETGPELGTAARRTIEQRFALESVADQLADLYTDLAASTLSKSAPVSHSKTGAIS